MELEYLPGGHLHPQNIINNNFDTVKGELDTVKGELDTVNAEFSESARIKAVTAGVTPDEQRPLTYWKEGRWVHMIGGGKFPTTLGQTFLVLPQTFSPGYQDEYFTATVTDSDVTRLCIVIIKMSGECQILVNSYSGNPVFLNGISFKTNTLAI